MKKLPIISQDGHWLAMVAVPDEDAAPGAHICVRFHRAPHLGRHELYAEFPRTAAEHEALGLTAAESLRVVKLVATEWFMRGEVLVLMPVSASQENNIKRLLGDREWVHA